MFRPLIFIAALAPTTALAGVCDGALDREVPAFEVAKSAMLAGDFATFYDAATPYATKDPATKSGFLDPLVANFPEGFSNCVTVVQRTETPGYVQEITLFFVDGVTGPISLYLAAVEVDGVMQPMSVVYNSDMDVVFDELR